MPKPNPRDQYQTAIQRLFYASHTRYAPTCSCGWIGHTTETRKEAENEATDHTTAAAT